MKLGDVVESPTRLVRILGRTPDQWQPDQPIEYNPKGQRIDPSAPVRSVYGRSHLLNGETTIEGPFDGWSCAHARIKQSQVTWWLQPSAVSGIVVAKTRCQWGNISSGGMVGSFLGEPEWEDPHFEQHGNFGAVFVAVELGSVRNFVMIPDG